jgi:hypothetical protein
MAKRNYQCHAETLSDATVITVVSVLKLAICTIGSVLILAT